MENFGIHTDLQLVRLYQETNDRAYFSELYKRLYPQVYRQCLGLVGSKDTAYEITETTFLHLSTVIPELGNAKIFFSYLSDKVNEDCTEALLVEGTNKKKALNYYYANSF